MSTMNDDQPSQCERVLAIIPASGPMPDAMLMEEAERCGWVLIEVTTPGAALRQVMLMRAAGVVVFIESDGAIAASALLVSCLHERRPKLPLIALAGTHSDDAERRLRAAGATAYVVGRAIASATGLINDALDSSVICAAIRAAPAHPPPPVARRRVPARIRGRPSAKFGSP